MGDNIPTGRRPSLEWMEAHIGGWNTNYAGIGLTSAQVIDLAQDVTNARGAFTSVEVIRDDAKTQTQVYYSQVDSARAKAADMVLTIKAFAENSDDPSAVYTLAGITGANPPSPAPAPDQPVINGAALNGDGSVSIGFTGNGPGGTVWQVFRTLSTETSPTFMGNADARTKSFTDSTVPSGVPSADYSVIGVRGSVSGPISFTFNVKFGLPNEGGQELGIAA